MSEDVKTKLANISVVNVQQIMQQYHDKLEELSRKAERSDEITY